MSWLHPEEHVSVGRRRGPNASLACLLRHRDGCVSSQPSGRGMLKWRRLAKRRLLQASRLCEGCELR